MTPARLFAHRIAVDTHCSIDEVYAMPLSRYLDWLEYFRAVSETSEGNAEMAEMSPEQIAAAFGATS